MTTVKPGPTTFVAVDGGMGDNLEVALVGQRFEATIADRVGGGQPVTVVGRHCESGDMISEGVPLRDPRVGDLLAVPVTGAYCYTMSNNYNGARRIPVVFADAAARGLSSAGSAGRSCWPGTSGPDRLAAAAAARGRSPGRLPPHGGVTARFGSKPGTSRRPRSPVSRW